MKKLIACLAILILVVFATGCGDTKVINGVEYDTYGLLNEEDNKNPDIEYEVVWGNVIWGVLLVETIIVPIYCWGYDLYEPVGLKPAIKGQKVR